MDNKKITKAERKSQTKRAILNAMLTLTIAFNLLVGLETTKKNRALEELNGERIKINEISEKINEERMELNEVSAKLNAEFNELIIRYSSYLDQVE